MYCESTFTRKRSVVTFFVGTTPDLPDLIHIFSLKTQFIPIVPSYSRLLFLLFFFPPPPPPPPPPITSSSLIPRKRILNQISGVSREDEKSTNQKTEDEDGNQKRELECIEDKNGARLEGCAYAHSQCRRTCTRRGGPWGLSRASNRQRGVK